MSSPPVPLAAFSVVRTLADYHSSPLGPTNTSLLPSPCTSQPCAFTRISSPFLVSIVSPLSQAPSSPFSFCLCLGGGEDDSGIRHRPDTEESDFSILCSMNLKSHRELVEIQKDRLCPYNTQGCTEPGTCHDPDSRTDIISQHRSQ